MGLHLAWPLQCVSLDRASFMSPDLPRIDRTPADAGQRVLLRGQWTAAQLGTRPVWRATQVALGGVAAVQALGPVLAMRFAQARPLAMQVTAAQAGTTVGAPPAASAQATTTATLPSGSAVQNNAAVEPLGTPKIAFDYTHIGREGADVFAAIVADELAQQVPALRGSLIP